MDMSRRSKRKCAPPECTAPWLLLLQGSYLQDQIFYVLSPLPYHQYYARKRIPEVSMSMIIGCRYGWLLHWHNFEGARLCLLNSVTLDKIVLPALVRNFKKFPNFALTAPPDDHLNCFVVLFDQDEAIFCRPRRDDHWTVQKTQIEGTGEQVEIECLVTCSGVFYASVVTENGMLLASVEFSGNQPLLMTIRSLELEFPSEYLVESRGQLFAVGYSLNLQDIHRVEVYRLDKDISGNKTVIWTEVQNLKNHVLFFGYNCCDSLQLKSNEATGLLTENSVYFTFEDDEGFYRYGLEDKSLTPFLPCPNLGNVSIRHFWVVPLSHQRLDTRIGQDKYDRYCKNKIGKGIIQRVMSNTIILKEGECGQNENFFASLPLDIIAFIAKLLPLSDYLNFCAVCKRFLKTSPWMTTSIMSEDHTNFTPSLLFLARTDGMLCNLIDPSPSNHDLFWSNTAPDFFRRATIGFSSKGWLLVYDDGGMLWSFNPVTRSGKKYPKGCTAAPTWGFSTSPTSPDCVVVGMDGERSLFCYLRHGDEDWNYYTPSESNGFDKVDNTPVYYEGAFYYLDRDGKLGAFELNENGCSWNIVAEEIPCEKICRENYLVECGGTLLSVFVGKFGQWIRVFRLHRPTMTWEKAESLDGHTLFLSRFSSFSAPAISAPMENRIYFLRFLEGNALYYSLDTGKFHSDGVDYPVDDFCGSRQLLQACWIQPRQ